MSPALPIGREDILDSSELSHLPFDPAAFSRRLAHWFSGAQRDLPWRRAENARDPYRVLVSEFMLQQTTVAAVVPFYERFLQRFPTLQSLAEASIEDVLPLWAGLGYYQRASHLHACARTVMEQYGGDFPRGLDRVLALPGIGRYTAGAVTSIAFDAPVPLVDANVARVLARVFCIAGDLKAPVNQRQLWRHAEEIIATCGGSERAANGVAGSNCRPSVVNPALMELGALICVPRAPRCEACPVASFCAARAAGRQNELPHATPKPARVDLRDACAFIRRGGILAGIEERRPEQILLRQRPHEAKVWWRGMWELPRATVAADESGEDTLRRALRNELGLADGSIHIGPRLKTLCHGVTHHRITLDCWSVRLNVDAEVDVEQAARAVRWFTWDEIAELAVPTAMRRLLEWLRQGCAAEGRPAATQPSLWPVAREEQPTECGVIAVHPS
jgi:A/G-specific adenine glycosylase